MNFAPHLDGAPPEPHEPLRSEKVRVLVVDDDERNLIAIRSIIEGIADVVTASSGEQALRELLRGNFAVILLDVIMPGMDGYETATLIRGREQTRHIPIIFLSAINKDELHLQRGYSMGAVDYVFKPVEPLALRSKVSVFVDLFRMAREIETNAARERRLLDDNIRAHAERLQAERSLRASEERQAAIIQSLPILLYVDDGAATGRRKLVAGGIAGLFSAKREPREWSLEEWLELVHPEDRKQTETALKERRNSVHTALEYRVKARHDGYRHVLDQSARLGESRSTFAGTLFDISDRKTLEDQLLQAQKMDALGKLTGGIAHDFNNLLAAVISGISLLERRLDLQDDLLKIANTVKLAAEQGAELVRRLLAFSRTQRLEPCRIEMQQLSEDVRELLSHTLGGRINLDWDVPANAWAPFADRSQLQLAIMNLVINARDAMPDGGRIWITSRNRRLKADNDHGLAGGEYVIITVKDEGVGMSDTVLEQVMEPFFTTKTAGKGTGLGLSMVYGFARQSGGTIDIDSAVGVGTSVHIWLPRAGSSAASNAAPSQSLQAASLEALDEPLRVLLVDDHDGVRQATAALLEDLGASVVDVASGEAMLKELEANPDGHDIIVTDFAMPGLSGDESIRRARALVKDIPAMIITGHANPQALVSVPERTVLLNKPFTPAKLLHALKRTLALMGEQSVS